jgi:hypothetical protein
MGKQLEDIIKSKVKLASEAEYREYDAINYSKLSTLSRDPKALDEEFVGTDSTLLGSIVDCMLTGGNYDDEYITSKVAKPAGMQGELVDIIFNSMDNYMLGDTVYQNDKDQDKVVFVDQFEAAYKKVGLKTPKLEGAIKNFLEKGGKEYFEYLFTVGDKTVVKADMKWKADEIVKVLKTNAFTKDYFAKQDSEDYQIFYQVPIVFNLPESCKKQEGKALLDMIVVNHKEKCIIPVDLKTTSSKATDFKSSFLKWNYYIQASMYSYGLNSLTDYEVMPFKFVVASTTDLYRPVTYRVSKKTLQIGRFGGQSPNSSYYTKGWEQLCQELIWLKETGNKEYHKDVHDANGCLTLDVFDKW